MCVDDETGIIVVGTTSGHLNVYGKNYSLLRNIQIWKLMSQQQKLDSCDESNFNCLTYYVYFLGYYNVRNCFLINLLLNKLKPSVQVS